MRAMTEIFTFSIFTNLASHLTLISDEILMVSVEGEQPIED